MSRQDLKNREPVNCAVDTKLNQALIQFAKKSRIPKSRLLDEAIEDLLKKHKIKY